MDIAKYDKAFLGCEKYDISFEEAEVVIIPFGLEKSVSYGGGTAKGPRAILNASCEVELFDEEFWVEPYKQIKIVTLAEFEIKKEIDQALEQIESKVEFILEQKKIPFILGGEHSLTAGAIRPFVRKYEQIVILHFDAHADLRDGYAGEHYSHASAMRRCLDFENLSVVSFGIRNISKEEVDYLEKNRNRINMVFSQDMKAINLKDIIKLFKGKTVYLSFDVDVFDISLMPATGTPEPYGLYWDEVMIIIKEVAKIATIVGVDVNELAPIENIKAYDFLVARLVYKIITYIYQQRFSI